MDESGAKLRERIKELSLQFQKNDIHGFTLLKSCLIWGSFFVYWFFIL